MSMPADPSTPPPPAPAPPVPPTPPAPPAPAADKTFTQAEVNDIAARSAAEAERKARQAVADSLGVPLDEAAAVIKRNNEAAEAAKTETQRALDAATAAQAAAATAAAEAARDRVEARTERLLGAVAPALEGEALTTVIGMLKLPAEVDDAAIQAEITRVQGLLPALFGAPAGGTPPPAPSGTGGAPPQGGTPPPPGGLAAGASRYADRKNKTAPVTTGANP